MSQYRRACAALALTVLLWPQPAAAQKFEGSPPGSSLPGSGGLKAGAPPSARPPAARQAEAGAAPAPDALQVEQGDPPARVGRIARVSGTVSFRLPEEQEWQPARLNEAVVAGHALWTEPGARAALEFGQSRLFADDGTSLEVAGLDEASLRATLSQGSVFLVLRGMAEAGEVVEVVTPQGVIASALDGRILIEAGDAGGPGRVAVFEGSAVVTAGGQEVTLAAGEALRLPEGEPPVWERAGPGTPLVAWAGGAAPLRAIPPTAAQAVRGMTGAADLGGFGRWENNAEYGDVWYPQAVAADWVPYSDGAWRWQEPWGWTWVDAAPWGFATSHYGRWVQSGRRWGWAPAPVRVVGFARPRPVWAPALVAFFGAGPGYGRPGRPGYGRPGVGWVPLGPREAWYPGYRASPGYVQRANLYQVRDLTVVRNVWVDRGRDGGDGRRGDGRADGPGGSGQRLDGFANRRAASVMAAEAMLASRDVRRDAQRLPQGAAGRAELLAAPPARPAGPRQADLPRAPGPPAGRVALVPDGRREPARGERPEGRGADPRPGEAGRGSVPNDTARRQQELLQQQEADRQRRQAEGQVGRRDAGGRPPEPGRERYIGEARGERPEGRGADPRPGEAGRGSVPNDTARRQQELLQRQEADRQRRQAEGQAGRRDAGGRPPETGRERDAGEARRQQEDQGRRQQEQMQRQQADQVRRQQEQLQRQQVEQSRRQQEDQGRRQQEQEQVQRQQSDQSRRQQEDQGRRQQEQVQRQQADQARRQQEDQGRRQQEQMRRQQEDQGRRQQEQMQRQQVEQARRQQEDQGRRQQEQMQRQQADQARRQQEDQGRRQQEQMQRQQADQARRQQEDQGRRQQEQAQRQQERAQRQR